MLFFLFGALCLLLMYIAGSPFIVSVGGQPSGRVRETSSLLVQAPELISPGQKAHIMLKIPGQ